MNLKKRIERLPLDVLKTLGYSVDGISKRGLKGYTIKNLTDRNPDIRISKRGLKAFALRRTVRRAWRIENLKKRIESLGLGSWWGRRFGTWGESQKEDWKIPRLRRRCQCNCVNCWISKRGLKVCTLLWTIHMLCRFESQKEDWKQCVSDNTCIQITSTESQKEDWKLF